MDGLIVIFDELGKFESMFCNTGNYCGILLGITRILQVSSPFWHVN
jgi:hypothetical protein